MAREFRVLRHGKRIFGEQLAEGNTIVVRQFDEDGKAGKEIVVDAARVEIETRGAWSPQPEGDEDAQLAVTAGRKAARGAPLSDEEQAAVDKATAAPKKRSTSKRSAAKKSTAKKSTAKRSTAKGKSSSKLG